MFPLMYADTQSIIFKRAPFITILFSYVSYPILLLRFQKLFALLIVYVLILLLLRK